MKQYLAGLMLLVTLQGAACAHDLVSNRLSLVQREANHVSLTLVIDYVQAMQAVAAPKASLKEFVIACAGMADGPLQRTLGQADVTSAQAIDGSEIQLPPALADMTVLSYKPVQTRVDALSHKATVRF